MLFDSRSIDMSFHELLWTVQLVMACLWKVWLCWSPGGGADCRRWEARPSTVAARGNALYLLGRLHPEMVVDGKPGKSSGLYHARYYGSYNVDPRYESGSEMLATIGDMLGRA